MSSTAVLQTTHYQKINTISKRIYLGGRNCILLFSGSQGGKRAIAKVVHSKSVHYRISPGVIRFDVQRTVNATPRASSTNWVRNPIGMKDIRSYCRHQIIGLVAHAVE